MPAAIPDIIPDVGAAVAMPVFPLLHVPPVVTLVSVVVLPIHSVLVPVIATGSALTVMLLAARQPVLNVYVIDAVPGVRPVTIPVLLPAVATDVFPLVQVPPPVFDSVIVDPGHTVVTPVIADGKALTVTAVVVVHPVPRE